MYAVIAIMMLKKANAALPPTSHDAGLGRKETKATKM